MDFMRDKRAQPSFSREECERLNDEALVMKLEFEAENIGASIDSPKNTALHVKGVNIVRSVLLQRLNRLRAKK